MKIFNSALLFYVLVIPAVGIAENPSHSTAVSKSKTEYNNLIDAGLERSERPESNKFISIFEKNFDKGSYGRNLREIPDKELASLFEGIYDLLFFSPGHEEKARLQAKIADELKNRKIMLTNPFIADYIAIAHKSLIEARLFVDANIFADKHKLNTKITLGNSNVNFENITRPRVLSVNKEKSIIQLKMSSVDLVDNYQIIVEMHPNCYFSREFAKALEDNKAMRLRFAGKTLWLVRQGGTIPVESIIEWNKEKKFSRLVVAYKNEEWPREVVFVGTPVFTFLQNGKVIYQVRGWNGNSTWNELNKGLDMIGY